VPHVICRGQSSQSIDYAPKSALRAAQRWLYRHIKTLIDLGKLVFEAGDTASAASQREPPRCRLSISGDSAD
jgi:hypothetical protein